jgi:hypothetical protein
MWGGKGNYEKTGAYRGMVVTHLFQVMAFVAIEPPTALQPLAISEAARRGCQWCLCDTWPFLMDRYPPGSLAGRRLLRRCTPGDPRACV